LSRGHVQAELKGERTPADQGGHTARTDWLVLLASGEA